MRNKLVGLSVTLIIAACGGGGGGGTNTNNSSITNTTPTLSLTASKLETVSGQNVTLTWNSGNTTTCTASGGWSGSKTTNGSETIKVAAGTNTYSLSCSGISTTVNITGLPYLLTVVHSDTPSYITSIANAQEIVRGIKNAGYGITFIQGSNSKNNVFTFPLSFDKLINMPPFQLVETSENKFSFVKFYENVGVGSPRAWSKIQIKGSNNKGLVLVDHGQEIGSHDSWLLGDVHVLYEKSNSFEFRKISTEKAFHHSVSIGDINEDGTEDIVLSHLGTGKNKPTDTIQSFTQTSDGDFQYNSFFNRNLYQAATTIYSSAGAVGLADLDGDGTLEGIQANYTDSTNAFNNWGALRFYKKNFQGNYVISNTLPRENNYLYMGASEITTFDYDNDKDLDILVFLEGTCTNKVGEYTCVALELYRNDGNLIFSRVTDLLFNQSKFSNTTDIQFGSVEIVDFNKDGFKDIYLEYGSPVVRINSNTLEFGKYLLKNEQGKGFKSMADDKQFTLAFANINNVPTALRFMDSTYDITRMFGFDANGTPTVVAIQAGK